MKRRDFVTFIGGATAWVTAARAQEPRRVIGVLDSGSYGGLLSGAEPAFFEGLRAAGFIEGENISIEWRWAGGQYALVITGGRTGQPRYRCACHLGRSSVACSKGCNQNDPHCLYERC